MKNRLVKAVASVTAARVLMNLVGLVSTFVLARILAPSDFGLAALATTILAIIGSLTELSLSDALVQHDRPTTDHFHTAWTLNLCRSIFIAVVFASAAVALASFFHEPRLVDIIWALSAGVILGGLKNPRAIMMTRDLIFWQQSFFQVSERVVTLIISIVIAIIYKSYWAIIIGSIVGQAVGTVLSYTVLPFLPRIRWSHARELFSFSIWLTFCQVINTINWKLDHLLVGYFFGKTSLGFYAIGDNLAALPTRELIAPITTTVFPAFSRLTKDPSRLASAYQSAQTLATAIALPIGVGFALVADIVVRLAMGEKWLSAVLVIQVLSSVFAVQTIASLAQPLAMATGDTEMLFWRDLQGFAMRIPIIIAGIYLGGFAGLIYARVLTGLISILFNMIVVRKLTALTILQQLRPNVSSLLSVALMAAVVLSIDVSLTVPETDLYLAIKLFLLVASGATVYVSSRLIFWLSSGRPSGPETEIIGFFQAFKPT